MSFCGWSSGEHYKDHFDSGVYCCSKCEAELFHSTTKFEHSSPWPAFSNTVTPDCLTKRSDGGSAYRVACAKCGNSLGHEFMKDGPDGQSRF